MKIEGIPHQPATTRCSEILAQVTKSPSDESSLSSAKETTILGTITDFFRGVWSWIKEYLFCLCVEGRGAQISALANELNEMWATVSKLGVKPVAIQEKFNTLSIGARLAIAAELDHELDFTGALSEEGEKVHALLTSCVKSEGIEAAIEKLDEENREALAEAFAHQLKELSPDLGDHLETARKILAADSPDPDLTKEAAKALLLSDIMAINPHWAIQGQRVVPKLILDARKHLSQKL